MQRCCCLDDRRDSICFERSVLPADVLNFIADLLTALTLGIASRIVEFTTLPKNPKLDLVLIEKPARTDQKILRHEILVVTLKHSGEEFVLDLACAQYGWDECVCPKSEYFASRVAQVQATRVVGSELRWNMQKIEGMETTSDPLVAVFYLNHKASPILKIVLEEWEEVTKAPMKAVLEGNLEQFLELKQYVTSIVAMVMSGEMVELRKREKEEEALEMGSPEMS
jgi:hypothetical protein